MALYIHNLQWWKHEYDYFKKHLQEFESMMCIKLGDVLLLDVTSGFHVTPKFSYSRTKKYFGTKKYLTINKAEEKRLLG